MTARKRTTLGLFCFGLAGLIQATPALAGAEYTLTVLSGLAGSGYSNAFAINNAGAIVGISTTRDSVTNLLSRSAWLSTPGSSTLQAFAPAAGYSATVLSGLNASGAVAGFNFDINTSYPHGNSVYTWSPGTGLRTLATPADAYSAAVSNLNNAGRAVGYIESTPLAYSAVTWDAAGAMSLMASTPTGAAKFANQINNNGQILVTGIDGSSTRDYLWDSHTGYAELAHLPGFGVSQGTDLNDAGHAVGDITDDPFGYTTGHAALWLDPSHVTDLGVLSGDTISYALGINASDTVVGVSAAEVGAPGHSFLWSARTGMVDLQSLFNPNDPLLGHISNVVANDINDAGQIVGSFYVDGVQEGFLLSPVPEPASAALLFSGLVAMGAGRLRRRARG